MKKRFIVLSIIIAGVITSAFILFNPSKGEEGDVLFATAKRGAFRVEVTSTGELSAERYVEIMAPTRGRSFGIYNMKIERIVEEGTLVRKGDFVAQLDLSEIDKKIQTEKDRLDGIIADYENAGIDTALTLRDNRDGLINLDYRIEEKQLQLEESLYEPPATIKKYENELEKLKRDKKRAIENYTLKVEKAKAKMVKASSNLKRVRNRYNSMQELLDEFTIFAPQAGMVVYKRYWNGDRIVAGSTINVWQPNVAELPDLSVMISKTYINEVDIRKVKPGQQVTVGLDAFPDKNLSGKVIKVARVGQQKPNSDAKVFEVVIRLNETDNDLRPAMTTSNIIITEKLDDVIYIPLECLHVYQDSVNYVVKKSGTLQEVKVRETNSNEAVIEMGLEEEETLYLSSPSFAEGKTPKLIPELDGTRNQQYEKVTPEEEWEEEDRRANSR